MGNSILDFLKRPVIGAASNNQGSLNTLGGLAAIIGGGLISGNNPEVGRGLGALMGVANRSSVKEKERKEIEEMYRRIQQQQQQPPPQQQGGAPGGFAPPGQQMPGGDFVPPGQGMPVPPGQPGSIIPEGAVSPTRMALLADLFKRQNENRGYAASQETRAGERHDLNMKQGRGQLFDDIRARAMQPEYDAQDSALNDARIAAQEALAAKRGRTSPGTSGAKPLTKDKIHKMITDSVGKRTDYASDEAYWGAYRAAQQELFPPPAEQQAPVDPLTDMQQAKAAGHGREEWEAQAVEDGLDPKNPEIQQMLDSVYGVSKPKRRGLTIKELLGAPTYNALGAAARGIKNAYTFKGVD